jgi:anthranilate/para-aminobenzoate synthase component I
MQVVADTFPAGTLSGAPTQAMQLIEEYENKLKFLWRRHWFYGF